MHRSKGAFTIIEMVVAIVIIAVLAAVTSQYVRQHRAKTRLARVSTDLVTIASALTQYAEDNNYIYPADANRDVPPGLERYLQNGQWPDSAWPHGVFDWDNWIHPTTGEQIYQISYRLCGPSDPDSDCSDPILFPNFGRNSAIFNCISGPCIPHSSAPTAPGYCINCVPKQQNY